MDEPADEFARLFPTAQFSDQDVLASTRMLEHGAGAMGPGIIVSAQVRRFGPPNSAALAFATRGGDRIGPFLLTPRVAAEIRKALVDSGF